MPRGLLYIPPAKLYRSKYNDGCYAQYEPKKSDILPTSHVMTATKPVARKPGHGPCFGFEGAMTLAPTRFLKGRATKSWVEYVQTTGKNNRFKSMTTTAQDSNVAVEKAQAEKKRS